MIRITKGDKAFAIELDEFFKERYKHIYNVEYIKLSSEKDNNDKMQYIYVDELINFLDMEDKLKGYSIERITSWVYEIIKPLIKKHKKKMECIMYCFNSGNRYIKKRYVVLEKKNRQLIYHVMDDEASYTYSDKYKKIIY